MNQISRYIDDGTINKNKMHTVSSPKKYIAFREEGSALHLWDNWMLSQIPVYLKQFRPLGNGSGSEGQS